MMEHEKQKFEEIQYRYAKYWMPFQWALSLCNEARRQQKIASDRLLEKVGEVGFSFLKKKVIYLHSFTNFEVITSTLVKIIRKYEVPKLKIFISNINRILQKKFDLLLYS